jgi:hypothetical protein
MPVKTIHPPVITDTSGFSRILKTNQLFASREIIEFQESQNANVAVMTCVDASRQLPIHPSGIT